MINRFPLSFNQFPLPAALLLVVLVLLSCSSDATVDVGGEWASGIDGAWVLDSLSVDGSEVAVLAGLEMSIEGGNINGNTGCNSFGGTLKTGDSGEASVADLFMTERACVDPERMVFEVTYAGALGEVDSWARGATVLTLASPRATIVYVVADPPVNLPLEQTSWVLETIFSGSGADGAASSTDQQTDAASMMITGGRVGFSADGCPNLEFDVLYEGTDAGMFDVMADGADIVPCEGVNWTALVNGAVRANQFEIDENRLTLLADTDLLIGLRAG